jgi:predicted membrane channel-forming protein YqfA (hemolysin III family)
MFRPIYNLPAKQGVTMNRPLQIRLAIALGCYAVLALITILTLEGWLRIVLLIFFAGLAFRTISAAGQMDE